MKRRLVYNIIICIFIVAAGIYGLMNDYLRSIHFLCWAIFSQLLLMEKNL